MMIQASFNFFRSYSIPIIIFLASLFCIISLSVPGLQINDEWITANQVHQIALGHQPFTNEGKYGKLSDGTSPYFNYRQDILGYSLILPLLSIPSLIFLLALGDEFRYGIILLWALIPAIIGSLIHISYPEYLRYKSKSILIPTYFISLIIFLINITIYTPFSSSLLSAPIEAAAIVFTDHILFALTVVLIYYIGEKLFNGNKRYAIIGAISIVSCSSMLYWASDAKDHMITIFLTCFILFLFISNISKNNQAYAALTFIITGLLVWTRPEIGFTFFIAVLISYFVYLIKIRNERQWNKKAMVIAMIIPIIVIVGLTPFFLNNFYLTHNPLYPPTLDMVELKGVSGGQEITNVAIKETSAPPKESEKLNNNSPFFFLLFIAHYFNPDPQVSFKDYIGAFFLPQFGHIMGVFPLTPLFLIGLVTLPTILISQWQRVTETDKITLILCSLMIVAVFMAYLNGFRGLTTSEGIGPDVRYFSTMYIPGGIIGLISMKYWRSIPLNISFRHCVGILLIGPVLILFLLLYFQPFGGGISQFNAILSVISLSLSLLICFLFALNELKGSFSQWIQLNFQLLLIIPLAWQIMLIFLFSLAKFDAYTYWIPITGYFFTGFFSPVG